MFLSKTVLGSGSFGTVYKATYKGEVCAAKMLAAHATNLFRGMRTTHLQEARLQCILKECSFLETLHHKNIVCHITTCIEPCNELPILVMELLDCNLKKFIVDQSPLDLSNQLPICHGIICGLQYLHTNNIIHRDLCDDNILLRHEPLLTVKISDFGLSKMLEYGAVEVTLTAIGHRQGYLPPEGIGKDTDKSGTAHYDHKLDIYSFGAVATQVILSAKHLRSSQELEETFQQIEELHPLKEVVACCLRKNSQERPRRSIWLTT